MLAAIHCETRIPWQVTRAQYFADGFRECGIPYRITDSRARLDEGFPVLLGTTCWREIESDGGEFLLVDRCSFGDTDRFVSLVWNGHGRRGDHRVPAHIDGARWERYGVTPQPWRRDGERIVLCGQTETYSPHWQRLDDWYNQVRATHFRRHPSGINPTVLPEARDFSRCITAVTLNSSVGVLTVISGVPTVTMDEGAMAWDVTGHSLDDIRMPDRTPWLHWLAWTQYTDDEIREGTPWAWHLS